MSVTKWQHMGQLCVDAPNGIVNCFFEILWGTSLVNDHFIYNQYTDKKKLTITEFREQVISSMIKKASSAMPGTSSAPSSTDSKHYLVTNIKDGVKKKARCSE